MKKLFLFLFFVLCFFLTTKADTKDFVLVNDTGTEIYGIYVSPAGDNSWSDNLFYEGYLDDGEEYETSFKSDEDACRWDIMLEDANGDYITWHNINLCRYHKITLHYDGNKATATYE